MKDGCKAQRNLQICNHVPKADIGRISLAATGKNLVMNMASRAFLMLQIGYAATNSAYSEGWGK